MNFSEYSLKGKPLYQVLFFALCASLYFWVMQNHRAVELADDGAFFLRYAENMLAGHFWVWNIGEAPIWGASAPLFPLFLAGPLSLGFDPITTVMYTGIVAGAIGLAIMAWLLANRVGLLAGIVFFTFTIVSSQLTYWVGSGLETPLTILFLALALFAVLGTSRAWVLGLAAGLLMIHKLDMVPVGGLVLLAGWLRDGRLPLKAVFLAFVLAIAWYLFAWWYFGAPIPNSFITKAIYQSNLVPIIDWHWYSQFVLKDGVNKLMSFCLIGLLFVRKSARPLLLVFGGLLLTHLVAYTIKHPMEPYAWYGMGAILSLAVLAALGVQSLSERAVAGDSFGILKYVLPPVAILSIALIDFLPKEAEHATAIKQYVMLMEGDRADAGRWVSKNTPRSFVVMAGHGNPAYFSQRAVIDSSFLNRPFDPANAFEKYRPEIFISPANSVDPEFKDPVFHNYQVVKLFDKTAISGVNNNYWFVVLARRDIVDHITDVNTGITVPMMIEKFIANASLGDQFGTLRPEGKDTVFVHPGATTPTTFDFDAKSFASKRGRDSVQIDVRISPQVPPEAIARGAATVRLTLTGKGGQLAQAVVKAGQPLHLNEQVKGDYVWRLSVDNLNGPDTDWILISFK